MTDLRIKHIGYYPESHFNREELSKLEKPFHLLNLQVHDFSLAPKSIGEIQRFGDHVVLIPASDITTVLLMQDKCGDNYALQAYVERPAPFGAGFFHPLTGGLSRRVYNLIYGHHILVGEQMEPGQIFMEPDLHTAVLYDEHGHAGTVRVEIPKYQE